MKLVIKFLLYSTLVVCLAAASTLIFKNHPEVQLAFLLPGVFILVYSKIRDDVYMTTSTRLRIARGR